MATMKYSLTGTTVNVFRSTYANGNGLYVCTETEDGEPYSTLTVNLAGYTFPPNAAAIDTNNNGEGVIADLIAADLINPERICVAAPADSYCTYPVYEFKIDKIPVMPNG